MGALGDAMDSSFGPVRGHCQASFTGQNAILPILWKLTMPADKGLLEHIL